MVAWVGLDYGGSQSFNDTINLKLKIREWELKLIFFLITLNLYNITNAYAIQSQYVWVKHPSKLQGNCYEVDTETGGQKYSNKVNKLICRPANTVHFWIGEKSNLKGHCYEADPETRGDKNHES